MLFGVSVIVSALGAIFYVAQAPHFVFGGIGLLYLVFLAICLRYIVKGGQWVFAIRDGIFTYESADEGEGFSLPIAEIVSLTQIDKVRRGSRGRGSGSPRIYVIGTDGRKHRIADNLRRDRLFVKLLAINPSIRKEFNTPGDVFRGGKDYARKEYD